MCDRLVTLCKVTTLEALRICHTQRSYHSRSGTRLSQSGGSALHPPDFDFSCVDMTLSGLVRVAIVRAISCPDCFNSFYTPTISVPIRTVSSLIKSRVAPLGNNTRRSVFPLWQWNLFSENFIFPSLLKHQNLKYSSIVLLININKQSM
jgi:hypothetical protein